MRHATVNVLQLDINPLGNLSQDYDRLALEIQAMHDAISPLDYVRLRRSPSKSDWPRGGTIFGRRIYWRAIQ